MHGKRTAALLVASALITGLYFLSTRPVPVAAAEACPPVTMDVLFPPTTLPVETTTTAPPSTTPPPTTTTTAPSTTTPAPTTTTPDTTTTTAFGETSTTAAPETSTRRPGALASLRPRIGVPPQARAAFYRAVPAVIAGWATSGFYLSLGAPLIAQELGGESHLAQGLVVTTLNGAGAVMCFVARRWSSRRITLYGTTTLAVGTALTLVALAAGSLPWFLAATVFAGTGFGAVLGHLRVGISAGLSGGLGDYRVETRSIRTGTGRQTVLQTGECCCA